MDQNIIYALDFDGVICDSAVETGISGWKAANQIWPDMPKQAPENLISHFCRLRPILETGYESILIMRALHQGENSQSIINNYPSLSAEWIEDVELSVTELKKIFGETRDDWINNDLKNWLQMNPLYQGVQPKLNALGDTDFPWYIITTKQERFVKQILADNDILIPPENIFGLDRQMSKEAVLIELQDIHPNNPIYFIEDRLPALQKVQNNPQLAKINLFLVDWGYNLEADRKQAQQSGIELLELNQFLNFQPAQIE